MGMYERLDGNIEIQVSDCDGLTSWKVHTSHAEVGLEEAEKCDSGMRHILVMLHPGAATAALWIA